MPVWIYTAKWEAVRCMHSLLSLLAQSCQGWFCRHASDSDATRWTEVTSLTVLLLVQKWWASQVMVAVGWALRLVGCLVYMVHFLFCTLTLFQRVCPECRTTGIPCLIHPQHEAWNRSEVVKGSTDHYRIDQPCILTTCAWCWLWLMESCVQTVMAIIAISADITQCMAIRLQFAAVLCGLKCKKLQKKKVLLRSTIVNAPAQWFASVLNVQSNLLSRFEPWLYWPHNSVV